MFESQPCITETRRRRENRRRRNWIPSYNENTTSYTSIPNEGAFVRLLMISGCWRESVFFVG